MAMRHTSSAATASPVVDSAQEKRIICVMQKPHTELFIVSMPKDRHSKQLHIQEWNSLLEVDRQIMSRVEDDVYTV